MNSVFVSGIHTDNLIGAEFVLDMILVSLSSQLETVKAVSATMKRGLLCNRVHIV